MSRKYNIGKLKKQTGTPPFYYRVYLRHCCDPTEPTIIVNYNFSFWISNSNIGIPSPQWVPPGYRLFDSFEDDNHDLSCWTIVKVIPGTFPNAPFVNTTLFKGCKSLYKVLSHVLNFIRPNHVSKVLYLKKYL